jgi:hypothetical protein
MIPQSPWTELQGSENDVILQCILYPKASVGSTLASIIVTPSSLGTRLMYTAPQWAHQKD